jgi:hypothetical protein
MLLSILSVFASLTLADPTSHFSGPIEMNIGGIHKESIVGKMEGRIGQGEGCEYRQDG